jgi:CheY-like chemotaxis protein
VETMVFTASLLRESFKDELAMDSLKQGLVLLGEDTENDIILFRFWMRKAGVNMNVLALDSGDKILRYLSGTAPYQNRTAFPLPELIFLDGQLHHQPSMGLLRWILEQPETRKIPVIVLTGSLDPKVRIEAKALGALECFEKPFTVQGWERLRELLSLKANPVDTASEESSFCMDERAQTPSRSSRS